MGIDSSVLVVIYIIINIGVGSQNLVTQPDLLGFFSF